MLTLGRAIRRQRVHLPKFGKLGADGLTYQKHGQKELEEQGFESRISRLSILSVLTQLHSRSTSASN